MELTVNGVGYHIEQFHEEQTQPLVLLHGFTGSTKTWHPLVPFLTGFRIVLIDLIGHGETDSPPDSARYSMENQVADLNAIFDRLQLQNIILTGYSMGGRTALAYACTHPERLRQLILESASPGLRTEEERISRRERDEALAGRILMEGIGAFTEYWENIPLFESQKALPEKVRLAVRKERLSQNPTGLAGSLKGMGTGAQRSYWEQLSGLPFPVVLITGTQDAKFTALAGKMKQQIPQAVHVECEAGHAIHVEKHEEFATIILEQANRNN